MTSTFLQPSKTLGHFLTPQLCVDRGPSIKSRSIHSRLPRSARHLPFDVDARIQHAWGQTGSQESFSMHWYAADLHLNHEAIFGFCKRPFGGGVRDGHPHLRRDLQHCRAG